MVSIIYKGRSLPLLWVTRKGKKGHFPEQMHMELIQAVHKLIPEGTNVTVLEMVNLMVSNGYHYWKITIGHIAVEPRKTASEYIVGISFCKQDKNVCHFVSELINT